MQNILQKVLNKFRKEPKAPKEEKISPKKKSVQGKRSTSKSKPGPLQSEQKRRSYQRPSPRKKGRPRRPAGSSATGASGTYPAENWDISRFKVAPLEGKTRFHDFDLPTPLFHAIFDLGFQYCTPIQTEILPSTLSGKDATGRAQTGTGKTAAFLITVITRMLNNPIQDKRKPGTPRVLVIAPTRELVLQISEEARQLAKYCALNIVSVFGGMDYEKQKKQLTNATVDIIVATPGRLLDFQRRGDLNLKRVEVMIIDEADRMLDMGFIPDVRKIIYSTPKKDKRQTLLFSATLTREVTRLAEQWTQDPVTIEIEPEQIAVDTVEQIVYLVTLSEKFALLFNIISKQNLDRVLIFCNRRDEVRRLAEMLTRYGINCAELSGDVPQNKRIRRLNDFKNKRVRALVATDVAGRGIHIEGMDHVINYTLPRDPEDYVHRIGRTGRAGSAGTSVSFADEEDAFYLPPIEKFMGRELNCIQPEDEWLTKPVPVHAKKKYKPRPARKTASGTRRKYQPRRKQAHSANR
ncbi:ATP-dependent RNA helicase RhlB [Thermodesulfobacteriota bacterium]